MPSPAGRSADAGRRTLLASPPPTEAVDRACLQRITEGHPRDRDVLVVSYERDAETVVDDLLSHLEDRPRNLGVVDVEDAARSVRATTGEARPRDIPTVAVSLADPHDIDVLLGVVEQFLDDWADSDATSVVYVDSLTGMIHRTGLVTTVGFVDRVGDLLAGGGHRSYFRLLRDAHDELTIATLDPRFGSHLALGDDDCWDELGSAAEAIDPAPDATAPLVDQTFEIFSHHRRRLLLHGLRLSGGRERLEDLAEFVSRWETDADGEPSDETIRQVYTGLWHVHIPKLADFGIVSFERSTGLVELVGPRRVEPYLSLSVGEDLDE